MKILQITGAPAAGGAEVFIRDLSTGLVGRGCDVMIVFISHAKDISLSEDFESEYLSILDSSNVSYTFLDLKNRLNFITGGIRLRSIVKNFSPNVVHVHLYYAAIYTFLLKEKTVYTHHNIELGVPAFFYKLIMNRLIDKYVGICRSCTDMLENVSGTDVNTIYNGVNDSRILVKEVYVQSKGVLTLLAVGRITKQKGYEILLNAVDECRRSTKLQFRLMIVGEPYGDYSQEIIDMADALGLTGDGYVEFLGCRTDVASLMKNADLFVMSSLWEGLPISQIEAAMTGLPMLVTDVGGCREVVDRCNCGIIVDPCDTKAFSASLIEILEDEEMRYRFSQNALQFSREFSISHSVEGHFNLYKDLR